eukprot:scaffold2923_cov313-Pinguiococcus_pyrenoidosus.AAC.26
MLLRSGAASKPICGRPAPFSITLCGGYGAASDQSVGSAALVCAYKLASSIFLCTSATTASDSRKAGSGGAVAAASSTASTLATARALSSRSLAISLISCVLLICPALSCPTSALMRCELSSLMAAPHPARPAT